MLRCHGFAEALLGAEGLAEKERWFLEGEAAGWKHPLGMLLTLTSFLDNMLEKFVFS